jgi:DNA adenine methylase
MPLAVSEAGTALPAPFLKWAGGKTQLLPRLASFFPADIPRYVEPFLGGGAVFFFLRGQGALTGEITLADNNAELINAYEAVQHNVDALIALLDKHRRLHSKEHFYEVRARAHRKGIPGAARTIYLNKTCFNGLYRVNRSGEFNVPIGAYKNPSLYDEAALRRASEALRGVRLVVQDFGKCIAATGRGDLLYLDPPYVPLSSTASFTGYVPGGFGPRDQEALAESVRAAHERGARFVLSNSYTDTVHRLYEHPDFHLERIPATRRINCDGAKRGPVDEAVVLNFDAAREGAGGCPDAR